MDRGMDRVRVWVCDPSLMYLAVAIYSCISYTGNMQFPKAYGEVLSLL